MFPCARLFHTGHRHLHESTVARDDRAVRTEWGRLGGPLIIRSDALRGGMDSAEIQRLRRSRSWLVLRPGAYLAAEAASGLGARELHRAKIDAALCHAAKDAVVSHQSAAILHGIALWKPPPPAVQVTRAGPGGGQLRRQLHTHRARLDRDEVVDIDGRSVTAVPRTLVDLARALPFDEGVVAVDHALHARLVSGRTLAEAVERASPRPGIRRARRTIRFADGASESVGESRSRVIIHCGGLPAPRCQMPIYDRHGFVWARPDFAWEELGTLGEFDGAGKYGRSVPAGQTPGDVVYEEKLREDRLRDLGWTVVRWTWADLDRPEALVARISRALERGRRGR